MLAMTGVEAEVIDVQTLIPFDTDHHIVNSLEKTNRIPFVNACLSDFIHDVHM